MNTLSHMHPTSFHPAARYHTGSASKPKSVCTLSSATSGPTEADGAVSGVLDAPPSPPPPSPPAVCPAEFNTTTNGECATAVPINSKKLVTPTPEACCAACAAVPVNVILYIYIFKIFYIYYYLPIMYKTALEGTLLGSAERGPPFNELRTQLLLQLVLTPTDLFNPLYLPFSKGMWDISVVSR